MVIILSFDVGVVHLAYCLLSNEDDKWKIIDWNNIDLTNREEQKCQCGAKAMLSNIINNEIKYYCKTHAKKIDTNVNPFEECYLVFDNTNKDKCIYNNCKRKASVKCSDKLYCLTHAKQLYKSEVKNKSMQKFKIKDSKTLNFDDVKYTLMMELEKRKNLLSADYVVIENQPSFKNPRMKSIASTIYDYYLMRGVIDREITKSNIKYVKFMSPSNKLKLASEGDTKELVLAKKEDGNAYKLTKALGIKYCSELINHLPEKLTFFNSFKKKDDLADSFLQGAYFYTRNIKN
jgi:hypothetical protein